MIARYAPGMGDPWNLTPAQWDAVLVRIHEMLVLESGDKISQANIQIKRVKRRARLKKAKEDSNHG